MRSLMQSRLLVPVITLLLIGGLVFGLIKLTKVLGDNLAPIRPRVLIFGATWCPYCPSDKAIQELANAFSDFEFEHIDVDKYPDLKREYNVRQLPTFIVLTEKPVRFNSLRQLIEWLKALRELNLRHMMEVLEAEPDGTD